MTPDNGAYVYHVTTAKKVARYEATGCILAPVRFWPGLFTAERWARRTGREIILRFPRPTTSYPLPDHRPAEWTPEMVRSWEVINAR